MKKTEENRISMFYAVQEVCDKHTAIWTATVAYANAFSDMKVNLGLIEDNIETQESELSGITKDKAEKKNAMVEKALEVAQATYAFAFDTGDVVLQGKVNYSRSNLFLGRDTVVGQRCQGVHTDATVVISSLAPYGIVPADLTALQTLIDDYVAVVSAPRSALTVRKGATADIDALVRQTMGILNNRMDRLMPEFKVPSPDFYQEYFDARIIVDLGGTQEEEEEPPPPTP